MKLQARQSLTRLTQSAIMVALATILSLITIYKSPYGGSVTLLSMAPIILISLKYGPGWGCLTSLAYAMLQMITGFYPPPVASVWNFFLVIVLDYVVAFGVLGLAGLIAKPFKNKALGAVIATVVVIGIRFLCHFTSGMIIWDVYAPEGQPLWLYSLTYNGFYLLIETITTSVFFFLFLSMFDLDTMRPRRKGPSKE